MYRCLNNMVNGKILTILALVLIIIIFVVGCAPTKNRVRYALKDGDPKELKFIDTKGQYECTSDTDCEEGICPDGSTYKKYTCSEARICTVINYVRDPCQSVVQPQLPAIEQNPIPLEQNTRINIIEPFCENFYSSTHVAERSNGEVVANLVTPACFPKYL